MRGTRLLLYRGTNSAGEVNMFDIRVFIATTLLVICTAVHAQTDLAWRVVNRFPLLTDQSFKSVESNWTQHTGTNKSMRNFIGSRLRARVTGDIPLVDFLLTDPANARKPQALFKASSDVVVELTLAGEGLGCSWNSEPVRESEPFAEGCTARIRVPLGSETVVRVTRAELTQETRVIPKDIVIVAMGDSYSSGEGSPDRPARYQDTATPKTNEWFLGAPAPENLPEWLDPVCHRSLLSWPVPASLRLALENIHTRVRLLNVACSGAEFLDGFFIAQAKTTTAHYEDRLLPTRDGEGARFLNPYKYGTRYLPRSQVNEVRDLLCDEATAETEDVTFTTYKFAARWRKCLHQSVKPDALILTAGGNDVKFGPAVRGVLLPSVARAPGAKQFALNRLRGFADVVSPLELAKRANAFSSAYAEFLEAASKGAMVEPSRTVLVTYPNPVGPAGVDCRSDSRPDRLKASFMAFGPAVRHASPSLFRKNINWVVELSAAEVRQFTEVAYPAVQRMQRTAEQRFVVVDWENEDPDLFTNRRLCTDEITQNRRSAQTALDATFFCQQVRGKDECPAPFKRKDRLGDWKFEAPGRRAVNSSNDALLAQRTWKARPTTNELGLALSGTFHPVTESHALAADAAYKGLCRALRPTHGVCAD